MKSILHIILVIIFLNINLLSMAQGDSYDERYAFTSFFDDFEGTTFDPVKCILRKIMEEGVK